jgi:hypothetical protein
LSVKWSSLVKRAAEENISVGKRASEHGVSYMGSVCVVVVVVVVVVAAVGWTGWMLYCY